MKKINEQTKEELIAQCEKLQQMYDSMVEIYESNLIEYNVAVAELSSMNKKLAFHKEEKEKRAAELALANEELALQNVEKEKRAAELALANKELALQNEEKEKRAEELKNKNEELQQFVYVASHDLQEPLRMVSSYTQLLARRYSDKLDQDAKDFINYAVDGAIRMQRLINDLLQYSRVSSNANKYQEVDVSIVLGHVRTVLNLLVEETQAVITNDDMPVVLGEESQLIQVFQNLIENAIKFRKNDQVPFIHIGCEKKGDMYQFSVKDNGIGIDPQYYDRIFVIFQRLHAAKDYPGTGMGLAINKRIIERHGGTIWVEPNGTEGTTFYFTIPV